MTDIDLKALRALIDAIGRWKYQSAADNRNLNEQLDKLITRKTVFELLDRLEEVETAIDCACNALTDSICASGNDPATNLHWVRKLRASLKRGEHEPG